MSTYSHSRLSTFEQCSLKYKYAYIDKVETEIVRTIETFMGDLVHQTLEKLYKDLKFLKLNELKELLNFYNDLWKKHWVEGILIVKDQYTEDNYRLMGEKMISDYYKRYHPFNQAKTIGLETQEFLDLDDKYKIHVRIDRLSSPKDGVYEIHDYKTNSNLKTQDELDKDRQLAIYAMGVKKMFPDAEEVILIWHFLAFDKEMRSHRTVEQLDVLRKEILQLITRVELETEFKPSPSALCDYCEFRSICPLWKHLYSLEEKTPEEFKADEGVILADKYADLKEKEKIIQKEIEEVSQRIRDFSDFFSVKRVYGSSSIITVWSKESMKFPGKNDLARGKFLDALKALNLYEKYVDIDNWSLEKDYDNFDEIEKQVLNHFGKKQKVSRLYLSERK